MVSSQGLYIIARLAVLAPARRLTATIEVGKPVILSQAPPPEDLYIDDPTLNIGAVKQVDWKAAGAKTSFTYKVVRNGETLIDKIFFSSFRPWQAVFMRGTKV